jgi:hypothetical protein
MGAVEPAETFIRRRIAELRHGNGGGNWDPLIHLSLNWLEANIPAGMPAPVIVHGDAGPGNFLYEGDRVTALLDWGFSHYGRVPVIAKTKPYAEVSVPFSDAQVALVAEDRARVTVPLDHTLVEQIVAPDTIELPVAQGDPVGEIVVYDGDQVVARRPLVSTATISEPTLPERVRWYSGRALDEARDTAVRGHPHEAVRAHALVKEQRRVRLAITMHADELAEVRVEEQIAVEDEDLPRASQDR